MSEIDYLENILKQDIHIDVKLLDLKYFFDNCQEDLFNELLFALKLQKLLKKKIKENNDARVGYEPMRDMSLDQELDLLEDLEKESEK